MKIEQMLHGYDNGHQLLASSVLLKNKADMDAMALLSDWSEYVAADGGDSSYLTAYPLKESGYYVIAKTWYADEMKRPGCVWTHSLLIPFDELNAIDDFLRIREYYERPNQETGFDAYSRTILYETGIITPDDYKPLNANRGLVALVLQTSLSRQAAAYFAEGIETRNMESIILAVMNMLPKGMLEYLSWSTGSSYSRKLNGQPLTIQVISRGNEKKVTRFNVEEDPWFNYVVTAIMRGDVNRGQLLRMFSGDIDDKCDYYSAIVRILYTLEDYFKKGDSRQERYKKALIIISEAFPSITSGHIIKKLLTNKGFSSRFCLEEDFFYLFSTLDINGVFDSVETGVDKWWTDFSANERQKYLLLLGKICKSGCVNDWGQRVLKESGKDLTSEELTEIAKTDLHVYNMLVLLAPSVLDKLLWADLTAGEVETLLPLLLDDRTQSGFTQWDSLLVILLEKGLNINSQLAQVLFVKNRRATHNLLDYLNGNELQYATYALTMELKQRESEILMWLSDVDSIKANVAYVIASTVDEHSHEVASRGASLWRVFLGLQNQNLKTEVYSFLFALSFNWKYDKDAIQLMRMAFYPLHVLESGGKLGYGDWLRISQYMESVMFWDEWDKCKKMRKTVVKRLQRAGMSKSVLEGFTPDLDLNEELKKMW
ncbi:MAG: hypothetical protein J6Q22_03255 [Prevotella sp.]|nr:hypothetical protein [Prevotella sp.]